MADDQPVRVPRAGPDAPVLVPVVWPDTGQDTVTLDLPGNGKDEKAIALRLTDIPVVEE